MAHVTQVVRRNRRKQVNQRLAVFWRQGTEQNPGPVFEGENLAVNEVFFCYHTMRSSAWAGGVSHTALLKALPQVLLMQRPAEVFELKVGWQPSGRAEK